MLLANCTQSGELDESTANYSISKESNWISFQARVYALIFSFHCCLIAFFRDEMSFGCADIRVSCGND